MNKIYKVIWSKAKHTYVVASEIAKGHTKGETTGRGLKKLAAAMLVAAALMGPNFAWAAGDMATVKDTTDVVQTVYTKDGTDNTFATKVSLTTEATDRANADSTLQTNIDNEVTNRKAADTQEAADRAAADKTLQSYIDTEATDRKNADKTIQQAVDAKANAADVYSKTDADAKFATNDQLQKDVAATNEELVKKANAADVYSKTETDNKLADKANTADVYSKTDADAKFATNEQLQKDVSATNLELAKKADKATTLAGYGITDAYTKAEVDTADANLQKAIDEEARKRKYSVTNLEKADQQLQTNIDTEKTAREAADTQEAAERAAADTKLQTAVDAKANAADVYSKTEADTKFATNDQLQKDVAATNLELAKKADKATTLAGYGITDAYTKAEVDTADANLQKAIDEEARKRKYSVTNLEKADQQLQTNINNEAAARKAADTKLVEAVNSGLSLSNDNVLQKNTTTIDAQGNVTTSKTDAKEMILNKGKDNQITLNENGIKVGTNSSVMDKDGVYTGGDTYSEAKAALKSDGSIKGADGKFTVNSANGTVSVNDQIELNGATGVVKSNGLNVGDGNFTVNSNGGVKAADGKITLNSDGSLKAADGKFTVDSNGAVKAANGNTTIDSNGNVKTVGTLSAADGSFKVDSTGKITSTGLDAGNGTIQTTGTVQAGNVKTGTLETTGNATIGGDLTVDKNLTVNGTFDAKTLSSTVDANNYTTINGGKTQSMNLKMDAKTGEFQASGSTFDETGSNAWANDNDSIGKSSMTADKISQSLSDNRDNPPNAASRVLSQNTNNKYEITDSVVEGNQSNVENRTADTTDSQISFKDDSGKVLNKSYITQNLKKVLMGVEEGDNKTTIEQDANNITNTAKNGTIKNDAKDLVNTATGNMTNTVGGKLLNDVTGDMENKVGGNLTTTVGGSQTTTVTGDSSLTAENINNTATNKITNKALDVETEAKSSIMNKVSNDYGSNTSTQLSYETKEEMSANGKTASYLRGAAEEKSQLTDGAKKTTIDTVAGQTNTNITEGKNISNSLQKADQAASSVTDGTNTTVVNQDAKSLASSITDGAKANNTSSTVDASVQRIQTDDTHYSVSSKSASKMEDALFNSSTVIDSLKDAEKGLVSTAVTDGATITGISQNAKDINLSAAGGTIASGAKNISNTAAEKLSNSAADIENKASKSILNQVGENTSWKMTDGTVVESVKDASGKTNQTTTTASDTYQFVKDGDNTLAKRTSSTNDNLNITDGNNTYTKITTATGNKQTVTDGMETASTNLTKSALNTLIENGTQSVLNHIAADTSYTVMNENGNGSRQQQTASEILDRVTDGKNTSEVKQTASEVAASAKNISNTATDKITSQIGDGSKVKSEMTADGITNTAKGGTIYNKSKDILNEASGDIINWADGEIGNVATKITNITGDNTVTSDTNGTTFENKAHSTAVKEGTITKTTISGNTITTGEAVMDYADVMKDLGVRGNATVDGNTTLGTDGKDTLTVNSTSTFKEKVTMEKDLNVKNEVLVNEGDKNQVRINKNGITVGLNSTVVDYEGVYVGGDTFEAAKAGMDKDGKLKAANGNFQVDTKGNVSAVSYTVKDTNIKIDNTGINAGGTKVTGLAPADISHAGSTDAVSGGQLYETNTRVSGLETRMGTVETRVDKLDNKIDKVGANAAAMANLHPLEFDEDSKWNVAAAVGSSGSETASAVGVFYRPNENVMVNASAAMGTGENMFGGGVSLRLGHGGNKAKEAQMKAAAAENKELRAKVDDLTARMDALLSVLNPNMSKDFPDVPENHWAYEAVSRLAGNGIVEGYEDGKYHGERQMTRYEMAEIIYNALSKGAKAEKKLVEEFRPELQAMAAQKKA